MVGTQYHALNRPGFQLDLEMKKRMQGQCFPSLAQESVHQTTLASNSQEPVYCRASWTNPATFLPPLPPREPGSSAPTLLTFRTEGFLHCTTGKPRGVGTR
ncbi:hypothetical protein KIL84_002380 [Mauremys mutica]|uniref:Uncharacterized protein n=1 Tax=Mauremys mutica TaxID=74926 RepID=A0A9D3X798_9SAUR|nr:hypothetical protein KIL84_002380 [Mauremys mutica]